MGQQVGGGAGKDRRIGNLDHPLGATTVPLRLAGVHEHHQSLPVLLLRRQAAELGELAEGLGLEFHGFVHQHPGAATQIGGRERQGADLGVVIHHLQQRYRHEALALAVVAISIKGQVIVGLVVAEVIGVVDREHSRPILPLRGWGIGKGPLARPADGAIGRVVGDGRCGEPGCHGGNNRIGGA